ncbi:MFS transporter [Diaminobutyricimonas sp. LJ205]|uniref:MFS transporter n=1 Tax=Diaminobutyricimonas sp. LJ205 TaxID=2683590 RepID=UPI0012F4ECC8|nr:MFS transporter [Diaminobutyricimonas sp. LJ205]
MNTVSLDKRAGEQSPAQKAVYTKILWRLMPFLCVLYFIANADRAALAYAGPAGMNQELALTAAAFGIVSGVFFIGYVFFEVPSSMLLQKFGARRWISRIIITWGIVQAISAWAPNEWTLGIFRVLLGICEAGFAPGVLFYLTLWLPARTRAWAYGIFFASAGSMAIFGGPVMSALIQWGEATQVLGLSGWRFMFLVTGIVPIVLGIMVLFLLPDNPRRATWLSNSEAELVEADLAKEQSEIPGGEHSSIAQGLKDWRTWVLGFAYFTVPYAAYTTTFFLPTMVTNFNVQYGFSLDPVQVAWIVAIPAVAGVTAALVTSRLIGRSLRYGAWALGLTSFGALGALIVTFSNSPFMMLAGLCMLAVCTSSVAAALFSIVPKLFAVAAAATAIALVNSICSLGGFAGPYLTGAIITASGSETLPFILIAALLVLGGSAMFLIDRYADRIRKRAALSAAAAPGDEVLQG